MARRLKTYLTSSGFFDLAVAAPSMKAAAEAWGSRTNVFKQGIAKETRNPAIIAATMARPGVVLRRPVGSNEPFREQAHLPKHLPIGKIQESPTKPAAKRSDPQARKADDKQARAAALAYEAEQKRRETERRKEEAARERERKHRELAVQRCEMALERAKRRHESKAKEIDRQREALEQRSRKEGDRWEKEMDRLEAALRRARE
jgi:hypothetical protein